MPEFLDPFVKLAMEHYGKVAQVARKRRDNLEAFARGGYRGFRGVR